MQNATNITTVGTTKSALSSTPAAPGAANTSTFFTHCRGRACFSSDRPRPGDVAAGCAVEVALTTRIPLARAAR